MDFGSRLKALREDAELSREELAYRLGISYHSLAKYETNNRFPDKEGLKKIADFFDVSADYLLCRVDTRNLNTVTFSDEETADLGNRLENIKKDLENCEGLMFYGNPLSKESLESLLEAMEVGLSMAKLKQKKSLLEKEISQNK